MSGAAVPPVWIADTVRPHHANTFAEEWFRLSWESGAMWDAFAATALLHWPYSDAYETTPEQDRYQEIEDEILRRMLEALLPAVMEAFTRAASDVLSRERDR